MDASPTWPATAPAERRTREFVLRPIKASDAAADFDAVMDSRADVIGWEQTGWPADDFTRQVDLLARLGMSPAFEVREPRKPVPYLAFATDGVRTI